MPFTPQPTNNTPETKILDSTFNEIAENDIYLKERADLVDTRLGQEVNSDSTPNFEDITLTGMTGTVEDRIETNSTDIDTLESKVGQSLNTSDSPTFAGITINGNALLTTSPTESTISLTTTTSVLIGRGCYLVFARASASSNTEVILEAYVDGAWREVERQNNGAVAEILSPFVVSNGADLRVRIDNTTATATVFLRKY